MQKFLAQRRVLISSTLVTLILSWLMFPLNHALVNARAPWGVLSLQFAFGPEKFEGIVQSWQPEAMGFFWRLMKLDYLYPLSYSFLIAGLLARLGGGKARFFLLPLVAALCDYLENSLHVFVLLKTGSFLSAPVFLASAFAAVKYTLLGISIMALISVLIQKSFRKKS